MRIQYGLVVIAELVCVVPHVVAQSGTSGIVISQVYGGGGNSGATLRNDFIELFNRGDKSITVTGWSIQYASATGSSWDRTLLSGVIQAGQYYLIQKAQGNGGSASLPTPDISGGINLSSTDGKIALVNNSTVLSGAVPSGAQIIDFVGYGSANAAEGSPVSALNNTTAAIRKSGGCTDTNNNRADFTLGSPAPRNSHSQANLCSPIPSKPDLVVTTLVAPTNGTVGGTLTGTSMTLKNQGGTAAGPFRAGYYLSPSTEMTSSTVYTGTSCSVSNGLAAGGTFSCNNGIGIPSSLSPGTWYLLALADDQSQVDESDESNNLHVSDSGAITLSGGATPILPPQFSALGVTNAASFVGGPVAPGEIITIFGSGLGPQSIATLELTEDLLYVTKSLAGTRVLFDGVPAPMIYTVATQVSAVVPYSVAGKSSTEVQVEYNGQTSSRVTVPVTESAPGIFTVGSTGDGQGAALNRDYSVNSSSNPAARGDVVVIYGTGGGQTTPAGEDARVVAASAKVKLPVSVRIGGVEAEVLYAGAAGGLVSGVLQVNVTVPDGLSGGPASVVISMGGIPSKSGVTISVAGPPIEVGTGPLIEEKLRQLKSDPNPQIIPEIPNDYAPVPRDWLGVISWNTQEGGTSTSPGAPRPGMIRAALSSMFGGTYQILAGQEIPNADSADLLTSLLPGGTLTWQATFFDSTDTMDNGLWYRTGITLRDSFSLFETEQKDSSGRLLPDLSRTTHPPVVAQFEIGDFDFTLITVHLKFADGDTGESAREMRNVLDYLDWYFKQSDHDPDVIVCGDFNMPSSLSGQSGTGGVTLDSIFDQDPRFQNGERRFVVTVHEPTTRTAAATGGLPANNYDHCVLSADTLKEFVQAHRVSSSILTDSPEDPEARLTSDHFPIAAFFKTRGDGVSLDLKKTIRPPAAGFN